MNCRRGRCADGSVMCSRAHCVILTRDLARSAHWIRGTNVFTIHDPAHYSSTETRIPLCLSLSKAREQSSFLLIARFAAPLHALRQARFVHQAV
jgi:hypothetical protein